MDKCTDKINIVLLTDCLADLMGGAERQIYELAKGLDKSKYNVTVASLECVGRAPRHLIEEAGCRFIDFRVKRVYGISGLVQGIRFLRFLKKERVDILQTYHFSSDIWGTLIARCAGVKTIISNRRDMGFWRTKRHIAAYRWVNRWIHTVVVVSESIKRLVASEEGVPEENIRTIYNGINLQDAGYKPSDVPELDLKDGERVVMHVANLTPVKGHQYLLKAMPKVLSGCPKAKLVLIGEGALRGELTGLAESLGVGRHVFFLGKREDARPLLTLADVCVLPSSSEGMSNAILEYMAAGKPVVACRVGGNPELVDEGQTGILVEKEDSGELSDALLALLNDARKCQDMGRRGLQKIKENFVMAAMVSAYDRLYDVCRHSRPIHILHLVSSNGLYGAEHVILNIAQSEEMVSYVGALYNAHNPHRELIDEAKKMGLKTAVFNSQGRVDLKTVARVGRFLKENQIDIIHTHNYKSDIIGFLAVLRGRTKWVATNHVWHGLDHKLRLYEGIDAFILRFASRVAAVSGEIKNDLIAKHIPAQKVHVVDNGIDIGRFDRPCPVESPRAEFNLDARDIVITIVGRLSPEKGHVTFLKAAQAVVSREGQVKFLIVGDGPLREDLHAQAQALGLGGRVIFAGARKDMPEIYALSDLMVNASSIEGLPMTILEAMAAKVPLIVTPVGAVPQVIQHELNGLIVNPGDDQRLAEAICSLLDDPARREALAARAYENVCERFSSTAMVSRYRNIYKNVLSERKF
jgi:glycosyltransferase involved in cell wall biosynthesis